MGSPYATQVADRWHLLSNLGDALEKILERFLRKRKALSTQSTELVGFNDPETEKSSPFEPMEDWQWNHLLKKSFEDMKHEACRRRLLPHLSASQSSARKITPVPGKRVASSKSTAAEA
jgi:hypothetical protein